MGNKEKSTIDIIINVIIIILSILVIFWFIQLIFGGSPGLSEFNFALIILITSFIIKICREIGEIKVGVKHSFINIKSDIDLIKKKLKVV
ncbi:MAG: hypothetical protein AABW50_02790 [Nanoarchaeota archaeon]